MKRAIILTLLVLVPPFAAWLLVSNRRFEEPMNLKTARSKSIDVRTSVEPVQSPLTTPIRSAEESMEPANDGSGWQTVDAKLISRSNTKGINRQRLARQQGLRGVYQLDETLAIDPASGREFYRIVQGFAADRILIKVAATTSLKQLEQMFPLTDPKPIGPPNWYEFRIEKPALNGVTDLVGQLKQRPDLTDYSEPDYVVSINRVPNDSQYSAADLWGLHNTGQKAGVVGADIDAEAAWNLRTDASSLIVAVIDTGIRYDHQDLIGNMWINPGESGSGKESNGLDDDGNGYIDDVHGINAILGNGDPMDDHNHGSHCAGTIAAQGNNGNGVAGVAWDARLMAIKFLNSGGSGAVSDAIKGVIYAVNKGALVLSNSWGGGGFSQAMLDSIKYARDAGVIFVAAAGNSSLDIVESSSYPAGYQADNMVTVASTTRQDELSDFSNTGWGIVDIAAPGSEILSTTAGSKSEYKTFSGTSMATPHVSGVLALLRAEYPSDSFRQAIHRLLRSTDPLSALSQGVTTSGRLNAYNALTETVNRPLNDDFAKRQTLPDRLHLSIRTSNRHGTSEPSEPSHAGFTTNRSLWWTWTAPANGVILADTTGSEVDTTLAFYTGNGLGNLTLVASNDDASSGKTTSSLTINVVAGNTYQLVVDTKPGTGGLVRLNFWLPVMNDDFSNAEDITASFPHTLSSANVTATKEVGEPNHAGKTGSHSLWWKWTAASNQEVRIDTRSSAADTLLAVYTGSVLSTLTLVVENDEYIDGHSQVKFQASTGTTYYVAIDSTEGKEGAVKLSFSYPPANDDYVRRTLITGSAPFSFSGTTIGSSMEPADAHSYSNTPGGVWFEWIPPQTGIYKFTFEKLALNFYTGCSVYTGENHATLTKLTEAGLGDPVFPAIAGTSYKILVIYAGDDPILGRTVPGDFNVAVTTVTRPLNDDFADRIDLGSTTPQTINGDTTGSSYQQSSPSSIGSSYRDVWYSFTPTVSGRYSFDIKGNLSLHRVRTFTGSVLDALKPPAGLILSGIDDLVIVEAVANVPLQINVSALEGFTRPFAFDVLSPPVNDRIADAIDLGGQVPGVPTVNLPGATLENVEPTPGFTYPSGSAWYSYTPAQDETLSLAMRNGLFFGMSILTQKPNGSYQLEASAQEYLTHPLIGGTRYFIGVYFRFSGAEVRTLEVSNQTNDQFENRTLLAIPSLSNGNSAAMTLQDGESSGLGFSANATVWYSFFSDRNQTVRITPVNGGFGQCRYRVFLGSDIATMTPVGPSSSSQASYNILSNTNYVIVVGDYRSSTTGNGAFSFTLTADRITNYTAWKNSHGLSAASLSSDLDGDGFPLFLEYATNTNPNARDTVHPLPLSPQPGPNFTAAFVVDAQKPEFDYFIEASSDLQVWETVAKVTATGAPVLYLHDHQVRTTTKLDNYRGVTVEAPAESDIMFYRLRIETSLGDQ